MPAPRGKKRNGIVIRGATGDFYVLREDFEKPLKIRKDSKLAMALQAHVKAHPAKQDVANDLPEDILELLADLFGPLGVWWIFRRR